MFLGLKKWWSAIQIGTVSSITVFSQYSEHLYLPLGKWSPVPSQCLFLSAPIHSPSGLPASVSLASYDHSLPTREDATKPSVVSVFLADRTVIIGTKLRHKGCKRDMFRFSYITCCSIPRSLISWTSMITWNEYQGISVCRFQSHSEPEREIFWWASTYPSLMQSSNSRSDFHGAVPHLDTSSIGHISVALLSDHTTRPLATAHQSV